MKFALSLKKFIKHELSAWWQLFSLDALLFNLKYRKQIKNIKRGDFYTGLPSYVVTDVFLFSLLEYPVVFIWQHNQSNNQFSTKLYITNQYILNAFCPPMKPKFKEGDIVVYINGSKWKIDCIKNYYKEGPNYTGYLLPKCLSSGSLYESYLKPYIPPDYNSFWTKFNE